MKKQNFLPALVLLLFGLSFAQCYYLEVVDDPEPVENVSFSTDIIPIFNGGCNIVGCHNTGGTAPDLSEANAYNSLKNGGYLDLAVPPDSELYQWMAGNRSIPMPLSGPDANNNAKVLKWIEDGAPNN
jgi:hypothetical protein